MRLYVDGVRVGHAADTTQGEEYLGYWRLGGDRLDRLARCCVRARRTSSARSTRSPIYPTALTPRRDPGPVRGANGGGAGNQPPTAAFTSTTRRPDRVVQSAGSSDSDGTITSYAWNFGDGSDGHRVTPSATYAAPGTYNVTLTVTDDDGATDTVRPRSRSTVVSPPASLAADAFNRTVADGWGSADTGGAWTLTTAGQQLRCRLGGVGNHAHGAQDLARRRT